MSSSEEEYESSDTDEEQNFATDVCILLFYSICSNDSRNNNIQQDIFQSSPSPKGRDGKKPPLRPKRSESPTKVEENRVCLRKALSLIT
jgi:hypothetical protein